MPTNESRAAENSAAFAAFCQYLELVDELGIDKRNEARGLILDRHPELEAELRDLFKTEPVTPVMNDFQVGSIIAARYRLLRKLGEGGMGTVWLAQQLSPVRRMVALKVIKRGMDSELVLARFEAERQALAMMEHDSIATFYDAGLTADGRSFFVMEYVPGVPINTFCDSVALSLKRRLELFQTACAAVQHAHQKGIIHRDLKPSNILVSDQHEKLTVKVIDFGLAKALTQKLSEKSIYTEHGQIIGTLQYMPPEQAELSALNVDTRADVYALGAILYELISGTPPLLKEQLKDAAFDAIVKLIRDSDFPRPSVRLSQSRETLASISAARRSEPKKLLAELNGDLDWITLKALEKDRTLRYGSAEDLRRDVERYLHHEPIEARPPSFSYKTKKWLKRHRITTAFVAMSVLAVFATLGGTSYGLYKSERSLGVAERAKEGEASQAKIAREETARAKKLQARAEQQKGISDIRLYTRTLAAAAYEAKQGDFAVGKELLASTEKSLRGFEYGHCRSKFSVLDGKARIPANQLCTAIAVGPKRLFHPPRPEVIACGTAEGSVWFGSLEDQSIDNFQFKPRLSTASGVVTALAFSESGRLLVAGTAGGRIAVSDTSRDLDHVIAKFTVPGIVQAVSIQAFDDHKTSELTNVIVAAADDKGNVFVWDAISGELLTKVRCEETLITSIAVGDEHDVFALVVGCESGTIRFWDDLTDAKPRFIEPLAHSGGVLDVEMNDLGVTTCGRDGTFMEWKIESKDLKSTWMRRSQLPAISAGQIGKMSPYMIWVGLDPKSIQQGKDKFLGCFLEDTRTGAIQTVVLGLDEAVNEGEPILADISGTGEFLAVGVGSEVQMRLRGFDKLTVPLPKQVICRFPGLRMDLNADPMHVLYLADFPDYGAPLESKSPVTSVARNHALNLVVTGSQNGSISLWEVSSQGIEGGEIQIESETSPRADQPITSIGFSTDDQWLIVIRQSAMEIFNVAQGTLQYSTSFASPIKSFETTADGRAIISAGHSIHYFWIDRPLETNVIDVGKPVGAAAIHPHGTWLAGITGKDEFWLHEVATGHTRFLDHPGVTSMLFHPVESRLVTAGRSFRVWDLNSQEKVWDEDLTPNEVGPVRLHFQLLEDDAVLIGIASKGEFWQIQTWNADMD